MSTDLFGSERFSAKIGESCCRMPTRAISFSVLISSLVIITLIFPRPSDIFGSFLFFFSVLLNIFALQFFLLILVRPLIFSPNSLDLLLSFEVLMVFNDVVFLDNRCGKVIFFWKNNIASLDSRLMPYQAPFSLSSVSDASNGSVVLTLVALSKFPTACGNLLRQKRALHGENLKL